MTRDRSLFKVFESMKGSNITFGDGSKSQIERKGIISLPGLPDITNVLYVEGLRVNLLSISKIRSRLHGTILKRKVSCHG